MPTNLKTRTISRETAKETYNNWIEFATEKLHFTKDDAPKSILIPISDVENVIKAFKIHDRRELSGIRIYLTRKYSLKEKPEGLYLACFVVPTVKSQSGKPNVHEDAIITIPPLPNHEQLKSSAAALTAGDGDSGGTETIYDMTYPCPPYCDGADSMG